MTNNKAFYLLPLFIVCALSSFSQGKTPSVIAAAGGTAKGANIILEWTVGEPIVETVSNTTSMYTQGFHQPVLQVQKWTNPKNASAAANTILVYPNPTTAIINIQLQKTYEQTLEVSLLDLNGKLVYRNNIPAAATAQQINVSRLSQGAYMLHIRDKKGTVQEEFRIIKIK